MSLRSDPGVRSKEWWGQVAVRTSNGIYRVLFLGTGNAGRSLLAEAILNHHANGRFVAFSAGTQAVGSPDSYAIGLLRRTMMPVDKLTSKSIESLKATEQAPMDFVFTVSEGARDLDISGWFGPTPMTAHWGVPDPFRATGPELERINAMREAFKMLERRIQLFVALPLESIDELLLKHTLADIGAS